MIVGWVRGLFALNPSSSLSLCPLVSQQHTHRRVQLDIMPEGWQYRRQV